MLKQIVAGVGAAIFWAAAFLPFRAQAAVIPYGSPGTENTATYSFAAVGGEIRAYFVNSEAAYTNKVGLLVNGIDTGIYGLDNHASVAGDFISFGSFAAGSSVVLSLLTNGDGGNTYFSTKTLNTDLFHHVYATAYSGTGLGGGIPAGIYAGFEDILRGGDRDYNDINVVYTGVAAVPEPSTWAMMLIGFAGLAFAARRRQETSALSNG